LKAAVIGHPIAHSLSPAIFNFIARQESCPLDYQAQEVLLENLLTYLQSVRSDREYVGLNVTIPFKEAVIPELDQITEEASAIGAVNVIQKNNASLIGFNTDVAGIRETFNSLHFSPENKVCLIWGAGGAAKAVAWTLGKLKAKTIYIFNPRSTRGSELEKKFNELFPKTHFQSIHTLEEIKTDEISLVVNSTPVGMKNIASNDDFFNGMNSLHFSGDALAFDLIYTTNPQKSERIATQHYWWSSHAGRSGHRHLENLCETGH